MTKKNPDKREQARQIKIEADNQSLRMRTVNLYRDGMSLRDAGKVVSRTPEFVRYWVDRLLDVHYETRFEGKKAILVRICELKPDWREQIKTKKPGPAPGFCPKV